MSPDPATEVEQLTPEEAARVDKTCDGFERAWQDARRAGTLPNIASFLDGCGLRERTVLVLELVALDRACRERYGVSVRPEDYAELGVAGETPVLSAARADRPNAAALADQPEAWPRLPGLELLEVLGSGGMGVVFKARQLALGRHVAIKVMRDVRLADSEGRARFLQEAHAVAMLQHAHLVQVYEFGEVPGVSGSMSQPYLVLEYVPGGNLADQLRGSPQRPAAAARLVETLAEAIQYAHARGIVHRDLKPANVLLALDATPKIADFGLAKFLGGSDLTRTGDVLGTPSYMAPEQVAGNHGVVGSAVDVYGLGSILYEVLTGRPPFLAETAIATVVQVQHEEPVPPRRLQPTVPRDLETICLKCLHKDGGRRYATAQELADDLRRFRTGEPIRARPVSTGERVVRWCRRKPAVAGLCAALMLVFLGGFAGVVWQWQRAENSAVDLKRERDKVVEQWERAERNLDRARKLVDRLTQIANDLTDQPGLDQTGRKLFQEALAFHQEVMKEKGSDPAVRLETARAFGRVGDIYHILRQWEKAQEALGAQIALMDGLPTEFSGTVRHRVELAHAHRMLAHVLRDSGKTHDARKAYDKAIDIEDQLQRDNPASGSMRIALANSLLNSVSVLTKDDAEEIERRRMRVVRLQMEAVEISRNDRGFQQELALGLSGLASLHFNRGRLPLAEDVSRDALRLRQKLHEEDTSERWFERYLAASHRQLASILAVTRPPEAEPQYQEALSLLEKLTKDFPLRPIYRVELAETQVELCRLLSEPDRFADFEKLIGRAIGHLDKLATDHAEEPDHLRKQAAAALLLGQRFRATRNYDGAEKAFRKMLVANERLILKFNGEPLDRYNRAWDLSLLSDVHELAGNPAEAERFMRQSIKEFRQLTGEFSGDADYSNALAGRGDELTRLLRKAGKLKESLEASVAAVADWQKLADNFDSDPAHWRGLANSLVQQGDLLRADRQYAEAAKVYRAAVRATPDDPRPLHMLASFLLTCPDAKLQAPAEARDLAQRANKVARSDAAILSTLGTAYYRTGDYRNAITALEASVRIGGASVDWLSLGMAYLKLGDSKAAAQRLKNQNSVPAK